MSMCSTTTSRTFPTHLMPAIGLAVCLASLSLLTLRPTLPAGDRSPIPVTREISTTPDTTPTHLQGESARRYLEQTDDGQSLMSAVTKGTYSINRVESTSRPRTTDDYVSFNPANSLRAQFSSVGVRVHSEAGPKWQMGLRLKGYGYGNRIQRVTSGDMKAHGNRLEISKHVVGAQALNEWYENRPDGLEQGFTLAAPPVTTSRREGRATEKLRFIVALTGDLHGEAAENGKSVWLKNGRGQRLATYSHLAAWDATGRDLPALMSARGREIGLEIDDAGATYPITIDPVIQQEVPLIPTTIPPANSEYGRIVAISGSTAVVTAQRENVGLPGRAGAVYIFVRKGSTWAQQQKLISTNTLSDARFIYNFGSSIAISGNTLVVGSIAGDFEQPRRQHGLAYIFVRHGTEWEEEQILTADDGQPLDSIGIAVDISGDTVILGNHTNDRGESGSNRAGSAFVFVRQGSTWSKQQRLSSGGDESVPDFFGFSVSISGDRAIVGAHVQQTGGAAYIFFRNGGTWSSPQLLQASDGTALDLFGYSVGINGTHAIIGAPSYPGHLGAAYIFEGSGATWTQQAKLTPTEVVGRNSFGESVGISGNTAVVGAHLQNKVYVYSRNGTSWPEQQILPPGGSAGLVDFGFRSGISGDTIVVGSSDVSLAYQTLDSDGDSLPDLWEISGVTVDSTGLVVGTGDLPDQGTFINLPAMGANPLHKDVFVHADYMQPDPSQPEVIFKPRARALKIVSDAFASAPVDNPDLKPGIHLHIDNGPTSIMNPVTGATWGALSKSGDVPFQTALGFYSDPPTNDEYDWTAFDTAKAAYFRPAGRAGIFHYSLFCSTYAGSDSSGLSRGVPASDFIVSLGDIGGGTFQQQAGTLMHELGHNLGLLHGGGDNINTKPNYLSIMNYAFQMGGLLNANGKRSFDYSRAVLPTLDEFALDENAGISDPALHFTLWSRFTRPNNPPGSNKCLDRDNYYSLFFPSRALDWDCDGVRAAAPYPNPNSNPDINNDGTCVVAAGTTLNTVPSGDDEYRAIRVTDSTLRRIVAGPNHICNTLAVGGDKQVRKAIDVEPNLLVGFKDWPALVFSGDGKIGNAAGASLPDQMSSPADEWTIDQILAVVPQSVRDEELVAPLDVVTFTPQTGAAPLIVSFDGGASTAVNGAVTSWTWDFGDGTTGSGATVNHTYNTPGDYFASLNVTDSNGHVNLVPVLNRIVVTAGPPPTPTPSATPTPIPTPTPTPGPGDVDPTYTAAVSRHYAEPVYTVIRQPDGKLIVGGEFESFGGCARRNIARVNPDGRCDPTFDPGLSMTNEFTGGGEVRRVDLPVKTLALQSDGKILVGVCECYSPNASNPRQFEVIFRLNVDGSLDSSFHAGLNVQGSRLNSIIVLPDGKILIGGGLTYNNNGPNAAIARLKTDGSVDSSFTLPLGNGFRGPGTSLSGGEVTAMALQSDGKIVIGGYFDRVGSTAVFHLARLNANGSLDLGFNTYNPQTGTCASGLVFPISLITNFAIQPDGKILLAGNLAGPVEARAKLARLNSDGTRDASYTPPFFDIRTIALRPDGKLWIGGDFQLTTPAVLNSLALLTVNGTIDPSFVNPGLNVGQRGIYASALHANGKLVVVGTFDAYNTERAESIVQLNDDGSRDPSFESNGPGLGSRVYSLVRQPDGKMIVGFDYFLVSSATKLNGDRRGGIGRLNADGTTDPTFTSPFDPESIVLGVALQPDGKVILGGIFRLLGSHEVIECARLNANGSVDTTFHPPNESGFHVGTNGAFAILPDGKILANQEHSRQGAIVRLNADGSRDNSFIVDLGVGAVNRIVLQPDQKILISGFFDGIDSRVMRIARLNPNGTFDTGFDPGNGPDNVVQAVVLQPDGKVLIAGWFLNFNGTRRPSLARLNADASLDTSFVPVNPNSDQFQNPRQVRAIALQQDGKLVVGSEHQSEGSGAPNRVFRLNSDGSLDPSFPLRVGVEGLMVEINSVVVQPDNTIIIGGAFNVVNGVARLGLARLLGPSQTTPTPTPTPAPTPTPVANTIQFNAASYGIAEDNTAVTVTVTRTGDTSQAATVEYATADGSASERSDYTTTLGTLRFAAGETSKTFDVLINEDSFVEGPESFTVTLTNPSAASLGALPTTTIQITDDLAEPAANVIDDTPNYVSQHYHDFLNRQPDASGLNFWTNEVVSCGLDPGCIEVKRINVSAAFFLSIEFQQTGYQIIRIYKSTFGDSPQHPRGFPRYREFLRDTQEIGRGVVVGQGDWELQLQQNKLDFARRWVMSPDFVALFPAGMGAEAYVDQLFSISGVTPTQNERAAVLAAYGSGDAEGRAQALLSATNNSSVYNKHFNAAFVLMQYLGYLRRMPDDAPDNNFAGFDFWLNKLNQFNGNYQQAEMVKSFLVSGEFRGRFGP